MLFPMFTSESLAIAHSVWVNYKIVCVDFQQIK